MDYQNILVEKKNQISLIMLNQPKKLNILDTGMLDDLEHAFVEVEKDSSIKVIVLTGSGKAFAAGANVKEMVKKNLEEAKDFALKGQKLFRFIETQPKPVIAALNGFALGGGCELACACDLRSATPVCKIGEPEVNLGIIPGWGGSVRLPRLIGLSLAKQMILTGEPLSGTEAKGVGLVNWLFNADELISETLNIASTLAEKPPLALAKAKKLLNESLDHPFEKAEKLEAQLFKDCFRTEDQKEGMQAFLEKRIPDFKGK